jgi:hypothetical protein
MASRNCRSTKVGDECHPQQAYLVLLVRTAKHELMSEATWVTKVGSVCLAISRPIVLDCSCVVVLSGGSQLVLKVELPSLFCRVRTETPATYSTKLSS